MSYTEIDMATIDEMLIEMSKVLSRLSVAAGGIRADVAQTVSAIAEGWR